MIEPSGKPEQSTNRSTGRPPSTRADRLARRAEVCRLNDAFRRSFAGGQVVETPGIVNLCEADRIALLLAVRRFDAFDAENDPYGERDFGAIEVGGVRCFWKIDSYDLAMVGQSPDPADPAVTERVMTVMLAEEY